mmetsp:Transcript_2860/g.9299  ORF Transcript_2860/g.9299 Transcript_2860/m.9299 type:complete len:360 (+) Transcript_2860:737-1816(+)
MSASSACDGDDVADADARARARPDVGLAATRPLTDDGRYSSGVTSYAYCPSSSWIRSPSRSRRAECFDRASGAGLASPFRAGRGTTNAGFAPTWVANSRGFLLAPRANSMVKVTCDRESRFSASPTDVLRPTTTGSSRTSIGERSLAGTLPSSASRGARCGCSRKPISSRPFLDESSDDCDASAAAAAAAVRGDDMDVDVSTGSRVASDDVADDSTDDEASSDRCTLPAAAAPSVALRLALLPPPPPDNAVRSAVASTIWLRRRFLDRRKLFDRRDATDDAMDAASGPAGALPTGTVDSESAPDETSGSPDSDESCAPVDATATGAESKRGRHAPPDDTRRGDSRPPDAVDGEWEEDRA